jgi:protein-disulfide isomerase
VLSKQSYDQKIQKDFMGGVRSGVNGTPTLFINGNRYPGAVEFKDLVSTIELLEH